EEAGAVRTGKTVYYRLKQIDTDNQFHYSPVMAVQMNAVATLFPAGDALAQLSNDNNTYCNTDVQPVNPNGQILLSKQSEIKMGF
ncbi:MAG: hypothetical protein ABI685_06065, partial [Ferruginibacter sp.]